MPFFPSYKHSYTKYNTSIQGSDNLFSAEKQTCCFNLTSPSMHSSLVGCLRTVLVAVYGTVYEI